jgi:hypothetical protein
MAWKWSARPLSAEAGGEEADGGGRRRAEAVIHQYQQEARVVFGRARGMANDLAVAADRPRGYAL